MAATASWKPVARSKRSARPAAPTAHVEIEIRDDSGQRLASGENGEICLRGPKVTRGYWKDPEKTKAAFFGDWFRTGDIGYLDDDGFLYLTDRKKDMIISGGENIASSEVERVIYEMPQVREVAVIGMPDARWGERPVAVVVLADSAALQLPDLADHCRKRLAAFKVPKQLIIRDICRAILRARCSSACCAPNSRPAHDASARNHFRQN